MIDFGMQYTYTQGGIIGERYERLTKEFSGKKLGDVRECCKSNVIYIEKTSHVVALTT